MSDGATEAVKKGKAFDDALRLRLLAYKVERESACGGGEGFGLRDLAQELGFHHTAVSKYLNSHPEGDVAAFESIAEDVIQSWEQRKKREEYSCFECATSNQVRAALELIRRTGVVGLIHGPAGIGKTSALALYLAQHPAAIGFSLTTWSGSAHGIEAHIAKCISMNGWKRKGKRIEFIVRKLHKSGRPLVIDNAQRMTPGGVAFLMDFKQETGCPIALSGNPEVLDTIRMSDQHASRIYFAREIKIPADDEVKRIVAMIVKQTAPEYLSAIEDLAFDIAKGSGHFRAVSDQVALMKEMLEKAGGDARKAWLMAGTQRVTAVVIPKHKRIRR